MRDFKLLTLQQKSAEDDKDIDDDSRRSSLSHDGITTDIGEVSEEGRERYLGGHTDSAHTAVQLDNEIQNHQNKNIQDNLKYDTTGSIDRGAEDVQAVAQVHHLSDSDVLSNDDKEPLLPNKHGK